MHSQNSFEKIKTTQALYIPGEKKPRYYNNCVKQKYIG